MDYLDYREQLGIGFDDEKKKRHFFTLIYNRLNLLENLPDFGISVDEYMAYCDRAGVRGEFYLDNSHMLFHSVVNSL